ncbi:MAG: ABC transporter permease subunit/CPBP intramembrane protease [Planctomycetota bacterium]
MESNRTPTDRKTQANRIAKTATSWASDGVYDAVIIIPPSITTARPSDAKSSDQVVEVLYNARRDQSARANVIAMGILDRWQQQWVQNRLAIRGINLAELKPARIEPFNLTPEHSQRAALWSKLLPFVMLIWAMTGAFYPAIDLVAGEKERGTLETLLCSPALRGEIVWGKLFAVTTFSMATAILNAGSMLMTSVFIFQHIGLGSESMGAPPLIPMLWLLVALIPLSALFSAMALAVAAMARSSKEGQYYLMPLMMMMLPLVLLPMLPGMDISIGTSIIPVTGMFLLVRTLVDGQFVTALFHLPIVFAVTIGCLSLATTWARRQFESESVLFGGADQWELSGWVKHLWRDRQRAATAPQAFACAAIILVGLFFGKLAVTELPSTYAGVAKLILYPQFGLILVPTLLMATVLTTSLKDSLRVRLGRPSSLLVAAVLGIALHPSYVMLASLISYAYPISEQAAASMKPFSDQIMAAPWLSAVFLMALVPAVCEELAFRGFIFGGLVRNRGRLRAVLVTALMFGVSHGVLQQSIAATVMGVLLGYVALKTGSVLPGILIHLANNALSVSLPRIADSTSPVASMIVTTSETGAPVYHPIYIIGSIAVAITAILYFINLDEDTADGSVDRIQGINWFRDPGASPL